eukprot:TRINITY_DN4566_c0_g2_i1.p1 TRINITY_DN4566_c0_g2~~TRINITY_DN4566_c0_g2_i1.p1  ORF type:complete len:1248 (+),score=291.63 TRINITY_DN4566_c0_g2_i1:200-3745(+)
MGDLTPPNVRKSSEDRSPSEELLSHAWTRKWNQKVGKPVKEFSVGVGDALKHAPLAWRFHRYLAQEKREGRTGIFDPFNTLPTSDNKGVPLGGIGGGGITRGWRGDFVRWTLTPGRAVYNAVTTDMFSVRVAKAVEETPVSADRDGGGPDGGDGDDSSVSDVSVTRMLRMQPKGDERSRGKRMSSRIPTSSSYLTDSESEHVSYHALYPRAWHVYEPASYIPAESGVPQVRLTCKQVSPFIPHDYRDSSLPVGVFEWTLENLDENEDADVSLMFTLENGIGDGNECDGGHFNKPFHHQRTREAAEGGDSNEGGHDKDARGVVLRHRYRQNIATKEGQYLVETDPLSLAISAVDDDGVEVSCCSRFVTESDGLDKDLWESFAKSGVISSDNVEFEPYSPAGVAIGAAVCAKTLIPRGGTKVIVFSLAWDMPVARFGSGQAYHRRYTKYFKSEEPTVTNTTTTTNANTNSIDVQEEKSAADVDAEINSKLNNATSPAKEMALYALGEYARWERAIDAWQMPILADTTLPSWYKATLFNELYYIVDGGSLWVTGEPESAKELKKVIRHSKVLKQPTPRSGSGAFDGNGGGAVSYGDSMMGIEEINQRANAVTTLYLLLLNEKKLLEDGLMLFAATWEGGDGGGGGSGGGGADATRRSSSAGNVGRVLLDVTTLEIGTTYHDVNGISVERISQTTVVIDNSIPLVIPAHSSGGDDNNAEGKVADNKGAERDDGRDGGGEGGSGDGGKDGGGESEDDKPLQSDVEPERSWGRQRSTDFGDDDDDDIGHFLYLESHDYLMYNTYDVHFYASFALISLFPRIELSIQRDFAVAVTHQYDHKWKLLGDGELAHRKVANSVPHDLGTPGEEPWVLVNSYRIHDINEWKDLNSKFVLQILRDYVATSDLSFLVDTWPAVCDAIERQYEFDTDGDGMIENSGFPDQTYDAWSVSGVSAYCGGLYLAAMKAVLEMGDTLIAHINAGADVVSEMNLNSILKVQRTCRNMLTKAEKVYDDTLWNGTYYDYDGSNSRQHDSIMADQMAGQWYARACGLELLDEDKVKSALKTVYDFNVRQFAGGKMGAINGMRPNGSVDRTSLQSCEVWTGTTYGVAACMIQEGMIEEAFRTAQGISECTYETLGYWFQTPEAWDTAGGYRAIGYMRPLSVWAMQWAWSRRSETDREVEDGVTAGE